MDDTTRIAIAVVAGTILVLAMLFFVVMLLVVNANCRHKHRAAMAEQDVRRAREVMDAERETTKLTLREVGRELHDNVGQLLTVAQMGLTAVLDNAPDPRLSAARDALEQGIEEVRRLGHDLNSDMWESRSFTDAISAEAERLERIGRMKAHVLLIGDIPPLSASEKTILFRSFQEILANALKHGGADTINITVEGGDGLRMTIRDNGNGFDPLHVKSNAGLLNIRQRCSVIGFDASCTTAPGQGCTWHIRSSMHHGT